MIGHSGAVPTVHQDNSGKARIPLHSTSRLELAANDSSRQSSSQLISIISIFRQVWNFVAMSHDIIFLFSTNSKTIWLPETFYVVMAIGMFVETISK